MSVAISAAQKGRLSEIEDIVIDNLIPEQDKFKN
jgi:hypothetical protein